MSIFKILDSIVYSYSFILTLSQDTQMKMDALLSLVPLMDSSLCPLREIFLPSFASVLPIR